MQANMFAFSFPGKHSSRDNVIPYIASSIFILNHMIYVPERVLIFARSAEYRNLIMATCFIDKESNSK